jgi:hypothetical protein
MDKVKLILADEPGHPDLLCQPVPHDIREHFGHAFARAFELIEILRPEKYHILDITLHPRNPIHDLFGIPAKPLA